MGALFLPLRPSLPLEDVVIFASEERPELMNEDVTRNRKRVVTDGLNERSHGRDEVEARNSFLIIVNTSLSG
jgi:hypothetical protein